MKNREVEKEKIISQTKSGGIQINYDSETPTFLSKSTINIEKRVSPCNQSSGAVVGVSAGYAAAAEHELSKYQRLTMVIGEQIF